MIHYLDVFKLLSTILSHLFIAMFNPIHIYPIYLASINIFNGTFSTPLYNVLPSLTWGTIQFATSFFHRISGSFCLWLQFKLFINFDHVFLLLESKFSFVDPSSAFSDKWNPNARKSATIIPVQQSPLLCKIIEISIKLLNQLTEYILSFSPQLSLNLDDVEVCIGGYYRLIVKKATVVTSFNASGVTIHATINEICFQDSSNLENDPDWSRLFRITQFFCKFDLSWKGTVTNAQISANEIELFVSKKGSEIVSDLISTFQNMSQTTAYNQLVNRKRYEIELNELCDLIDRLSTNHPHSIEETVDPWTYYPTMTGPSSTMASTQFYSPIRGIDVFRVTVTIQLSNDQSQQLLATGIHFESSDYDGSQWVRNFSFQSIDTVIAGNRASPLLPMSRTDSMDGSQLFSIEWKCHWYQATDETVVSVPAAHGTSSRSLPLTIDLAAFRTLSHLLDCFSHTQLLSNSYQRLSQMKKQSEQLSYQIVNYSGNKGNILLWDELNVLLPDLLMTFTHTILMDPTDSQARYQRRKLFGVNILNPHLFLERAESDSGLGSIGLQVQRIEVSNELTSRPAVDMFHGAGHILIGRELILSVNRLGFRMKASTYRRDGGKRKTDLDLLSQLRLVNPSERGLNLLQQVEYFMDQTMHSLPFEQRGLDIESADSDAASDQVAVDRDTSSRNQSILIDEILCHSNESDVEIAGILLNSFSAASSTPTTLTDDWTIDRIGRNYYKTVLLQSLQPSLTVIEVRNVQVDLTCHPQHRHGATTEIEDPSNPEKPTVYRFLKDNSFVFESENLFGTAALGPTASYFSKWKLFVGGTVAMVRSGNPLTSDEHETGRGKSPKQEVVIFHSIPDAAQCEFLQTLSSRSSSQDLVGQSLRCVCESTSILHVVHSCDLPSSNGYYSAISVPTTMLKLNIGNVSLDLDTEYLRELLCTIHMFVTTMKRSAGKSHPEAVSLHEGTNVSSSKEANQLPSFPGPDSPTFVFCLQSEQCVVAAQHHLRPVFTLSMKQVEIYQSVFCDDMNQLSASCTSVHLFETSTPYSHHTCLVGDLLPNKFVAHGTSSSSKYVPHPNAVDLHFTSYKSCSIDQYPLLEICVEFARVVYLQRATMTIVVYIRDHFLPTVFGVIQRGVDFDLLAAYRGQTSPSSTQPEDPTLHVNPSNQNGLFRTGMMRIVVIASNVELYLPVNSASTDSLVVNIPKGMFYKTCPEMDQMGFDSYCRGPYVTFGIWISQRIALKYLIAASTDGSSIVWGELKATQSSSPTMGLTHLLWTRAVRIDYERKEFTWRDLVSRADPPHDLTQSGSKQLFFKFEAQNAIVCSWCSPNAIGKDVELRGRFEMIPITNDPVDGTFIEDTVSTQPSRIRNCILLGFDTDQIDWTLSQGQYWMIVNIIQQNFAELQLLVEDFFLYPEPKAVDDLEESVYGRYCLDRTLPIVNSIPVRIGSALITAVENLPDYYKAFNHPLPSKRSVREMLDCPALGDTAPTFAHHFKFRYKNQSLFKNRFIKEASPSPFEDRLIPQHLFRCEEDSSSSCAELVRPLSLLMKDRDYSAKLNLFSSSEKSKKGVEAFASDLVGSDDASDPDTAMHRVDDLDPTASNSTHNVASSRPIGDVIFQMHLKMFELDFYRMHFGGGNGIEIVADSFIITDGSQSNQDETPSVTDIPLESILFAPRSFQGFHGQRSADPDQPPHKRHLEPFDVKTHRVRRGLTEPLERFKRPPSDKHIRYSQQGCGNLRRCVVSIDQSVAVCNIPKIFDFIRCVHKPIRVNSLRNLLFLKNQGHGLFDYRAALDVEIHVTDSIICMQNVSRQEGINSLCGLVDLSYLHSWRGFPFSGPGLIRAIVDAQLHALYIAPMHELYNPQIQSLCERFKFHFMTELRVLPESDAAEENFRLLERSLSFDAKMSQPNRIELRPCAIRSIIVQLNPNPIVELNYQLSDGTLKADGSESVIEESIEVVPLNSSENEMEEIKDEPVQPPSIGRTKTIDAIQIPSSVGEIETELTETAEEPVNDLGEDEQNDNENENRSMIRFKVSLKDLIFITMAAQQLKEKLDFRNELIRRIDSQGDAFHAIITHTPDIAHLPLLTHYLIHTPLSVPYQVDMKQFTGKLCDVEAIVRNNSYNITILKSKVSNILVQYDRNLNNVHGVASCLFSVWTFNELIDEFEPLIEPFKLGSIAVTDNSYKLSAVNRHSSQFVSSINRIPHIRVVVDTQPVEINGALTSWSDFVRKINLADVVTTSSVHLPPYKIINHLGVPLQFSVGMDGRVLVTGDINARESLPIEVQQLAEALNNYKSKRQFQINRRSIQGLGKLSNSNSKEYLIGISFNNLRDVYESRHPVPIDKEGIYPFEMMLPTDPTDNKFNFPTKKVSDATIQSSTDLASDKESAPARLEIESNPTAAATQPNTKFVQELPLALMDMKIKDDGVRELIIRSILTIVNHTQRSLRVSLHLYGALVEASVKPGKEWHVPVRYANPKSALHLSVDGTNEWMEALPQLGSLLLQGFWGNATKLKAELMACTIGNTSNVDRNWILMMKPEAQDLVSRQSIRSSRERESAQSFVSVKYPTRDTLQKPWVASQSDAMTSSGGKPVLNNMDNTAEEANNRRRRNPSRTQPLRLILQAPVQLCNLLCQPLLYRLADSDTPEGTIINEGLLLPGDIVDVHEIFHLYSTKIFVSLRILNYAWSKWTKVFSRQNPYHISEKVSEITLESLTLTSSSKVFSPNLPKEQVWSMPSTDITMTTKESLVRFSCTLIICNRTGFPLELCEASAPDSMIPLISRSVPESFLRSDDNDPAARAKGRYWGNRTMSGAESNIRIKNVGNLSPMVKSYPTAPRDPFRNLIEEINNVQSSSEVIDIFTGSDDQYDPNDLVPTESALVNEGLLDVRKPFLPSRIQSTRQESTALKPKRLIIHLPQNHLAKITYEATADMTLSDVFSHIKDMVSSCNEHQVEAKYVFIYWEGGIAGSRKVLDCISKSPAANTGSISPSITPTNGQQLQSSNLEMVENSDDSLPVEEAKPPPAASNGVAGRMFMRQPSVKAPTKQAKSPSTGIEREVPLHLQYCMLSTGEYCTITMDTKVGALMGNRLRLCHQAEWNIYQQIAAIKTIVTESEGLFSSIFSRAKVQHVAPYINPEGDTVFHPHRMLGFSPFLSIRINRPDDNIEKSLISEWTDGVDVLRSDFDTDEFKFKVKSIRKSVGTNYRDRHFEFGLHIEKGQALLHNIITATIVPKYLLRSRISYPIELRQIVTSSLDSSTNEPTVEDSVLFLGSTAIKSFHFQHQNSLKLIQIRRPSTTNSTATDEGWCGEIDITHIGIMFAKINNPLSIIKVEVEVIGASFIATCTEQSLKWPPYRIDNSSSHTLRFKQNQANKAVNKNIPNPKAKSLPTIADPDHPTIIEPGDSVNTQENTPNRPVNTMEDKSEPTESEMEWNYCLPGGSVPFAWDYPISGVKQLKVEIQQINQWIAKDIEIDDEAQFEIVRVNKVVPNLGNPQAEGYLQIYDSSTDSWVAMYAILRSDIIYLYSDHTRGNLVDLINLTAHTSISHTVGDKDNGSMVTDDYPNIDFACIVKYENSKGWDIFNSIQSSVGYIGSVMIWSSASTPLANHIPGSASANLEVNKTRILCLKIAEKVGLIDAVAHIILKQLQHKTRRSEDDNDGDDNRVKDDPIDSQEAETGSMKLVDLLRLGASVDQLLDEIGSVSMGIDKVVTALMAAGEARDIIGAYDIIEWMIDLEVMKPVVIAEAEPFESQTPVIEEKPILSEEGNDNLESEALDDVTSPPGISGMLLSTLNAAANVVGAAAGAAVSVGVSTGTSVLSLRISPSQDTLRDTVDTPRSDTLMPVVNVKERDEVTVASEAADSLSDVNQITASNTTTIDIDPDQIDLSSRENKSIDHIPADQRYSVSTVLLGLTGLSAEPDTFRKDSLVREASMVIQSQLISSSKAGVTKQVKKQQKLLQLAKKRRDGILQKHRTSEFSLSPPKLLPELLALLEASRDSDPVEDTSQPTAAAADSIYGLTIFLDASKRHLKFTSESEFYAWFQCVRQSVETAWVHYYLGIKTERDHHVISDFQSTLSLKSRADGPTKVLEVIQLDSSAEESLQLVDRNKSSNRLFGPSSSGTRKSSRLKAGMKLKEWGNRQLNDKESMKDEVTTEHDQQKLSVFFEVPSLSVSLIDFGPTELLYFQMKGIQMNVERTFEMVKFAVTVQTVQVSNQLLNPIYTVFLFPRRMATQPRVDEQSGTTPRLMLPGLDPNYSTFPTLHLFLQQRYHLKSVGSESEKDQPQSLDALEKELARQMPSTATGNLRDAIKNTVGVEYETNLRYFDMFTIWLAPMQLDLDEEAVVRLIRYIQDVRSVWGLLKYTSNKIQKIAVDYDVLSSSSHKNWGQLNRRAVMELFSQFIGSCKSTYMGFDSIQKNTTGIYFSSLQLHPIDVVLSFRPSPNFVTTNSEMAITSIISQLNGARLCLNALLTESAYGTTSIIAGILYKHYRAAVWRQIQTLLGATDFVEGSVGLVANLGTGVYDLFYEPIDGLIGESGSFLTGLSRGGRSLATRAIGGTSAFTSSITGGIGKGVSMLTLDSEFQKSRLSRRFQRTNTVSEGIYVGTKELGKNIVEGVTGIVVSPYRGLVTGGGVGFGIGVAKGILGVALKPAVGVFDLASMTAEGIRNTAFNSNKDTMDDRLGVHRSRIPRAFGRSNQLLCFNVRTAAAQYVADYLNGFQVEPRLHVVHHMQIRRSLIQKYHRARHSADFGQRHIQSDSSDMHSVMDSYQEEVKKNQKLTISDEVRGEVQPQEENADNGEITLQPSQFVSSNEEVPQPIEIKPRSARHHERWGMVVGKSFVVLVTPSRVVLTQISRPDPANSTSSTLSSRSDKSISMVFVWSCPAECIDQLYSDSYGDLILTMSTSVHITGTWNRPHPVAMSNESKDYLIFQSLLEQTLGITLARMQPLYPMYGLLQSDIQKRYLTGLKSYLLSPTRHTYRLFRHVLYEYTRRSSSSTTTSTTPTSKATDPSDGAVEKDRLVEKRMESNQDAIAANSEEFMNKQILKLFVDNKGTRLQKMDPSTASAEMALNESQLDSDYYLSFVYPLVDLFLIGPVAEDNGKSYSVTISRIDKGKMRLIRKESEDSDHFTEYLKVNLSLIFTSHESASIWRRNLEASILIGSTDNVIPSSPLIVEDKKKASRSVMTLSRSTANNDDVLTPWENSILGMLIIPTSGCSPEDTESLKIEVGKTLSEFRR